MSNYTMTGSLIVLKETQTFDSGFTKREFVIRTEGDYPQEVMFELIKDKTSIIDKYKQGDQVEVHFNIRGREYNGRYFVNLSAWKVDAVGGGTADQPAEHPGMASAPPPSSPPPADDTDDLPF